MDGKVNQSIKCRVKNCKYHDVTEYCTLQDIVVGTDSMDTKDCCETECLSFKCEC